MICYHYFHLLLSNYIINVIIISIKVIIVIKMSQMARELVRLGAEVDRIGSDGMTPLHYACRSQCSIARSDVVKGLTIVQISTY